MAGTAVWVSWAMVEALICSPGRWTAQRMRMPRLTEPMVRDGQPRSSPIRAALPIKKAANSGSSSGSLLLTPCRVRGMSNSVSSVQRGGTECKLTLIGSGGASRGGGPPRGRTVPMMNSWCPVWAATVRSTRILSSGPAIRPAWRRHSWQRPSIAATSRWQMSQRRLVAFATKPQHALQRGRSNQPQPRQSRQLRVAHVRGGVPERIAAEEHARGSSPPTRGGPVSSTAGTDPAAFPPNPRSGPVAGQRTTGRLGPPSFLQVSRRDTHVPPADEEPTGGFPPSGEWPA